MRTPAVDEAAQQKAPELIIRMASWQGQMQRAWAALAQRAWPVLLLAAAAAAALAVAKCGRGAGNRSVAHPPELVAMWEAALG